MNNFKKRKKPINRKSRRRSDVAFQFQNKTNQVLQKSTITFFDLNFYKNNF